MPEKNFTALSASRNSGIEREPNAKLLRILFSNPNGIKKGPAILIDRDGVINCRRPGDYVLEWSQFIFVPGIRSTLKQLASLGLPMIVISNQAAIGKGLLDLAVLKEITAKMHQALLEDGTSLAAAYYCIHKADENCPCRKPKPGLLQAAAGDFDIDLRRSVFIGDSATDIQAAQAAGCPPVLFCSEDGPPPGSPADLLIATRVTELYALVARCLQSPARA